MDIALRALAERIFSADISLLDKHIVQDGMNQTRFASVPNAILGMSLIDNHLLVGLLNGMV